MLISGIMITQTAMNGWSELLTSTFPPEFPAFLGPLFAAKASNLDQNRAMWDDIIKCRMRDDLTSFKELPFRKSANKQVPD